MPTNCIFAIDGYLALGTSTPGYGDKLRIKQSVNTMYAFWLENYNTAQAITLGINDGIARIQTDYAAIGDIPLQIQSYTSAYMYFKPAGGIGINTTSPVGKLDVSTGGNTNIVISNDSTDTGYNIISLNGTRTKGSYAGIAGGGTGDNKLYLNSGVDVVIQTGASYTARMTITCCGNIGIGTSSPAPLRGDKTLHICSAYPSMILQSTGVAQKWELTANYYGTCTSLEIWDGNAAKAHTTFMCGGYLGIGTTAPTQMVHAVRDGGGSGVGLLVQDSSSTFGGCTYMGVYLGHSYIQTSAGKDLQLWDSNCARMVIKSGGNIGINTCTPGTYRLNVNGSFYAAGSSQDYKQSICNYNTDSCMFMKLKPVTYQYKEEYCHLGKELKSGTQIGLIAEEVAESHPELAILVNEEDNKVVRNVDYEKLTIILLSELQKLRQEVDQLKNK